MGKQILLDAFRNKKAERVPWVPFVGCHGGALIGVPADEYLKSTEHIVRGAKEAIKRYQPDGIPIAFDLQIEAEALGCELNWAEDNPPAVIGHILEKKSLHELNNIDENSGRIPIVLEAVRKLKSEDEDVAIYGLVTGPFTLALHLQGTQIFMDMFDQPAKVNELMLFTQRIAAQVSSMYLDAGCDIIALVDPMTSQISPDAFREFVTPSAKFVFDEIRARKALSSFFVCGHAQRNVEAMCETGPDNVSVDENIPLGYVKEVCQKFGISFGGNLQLTVVLLMGDEEAAQRNALECMRIGGDTGFILAPGCDLPYGVPPENLEAIAKLVHDPYQQQVASELFEKKKEVQVDLDLIDYGYSEKVIVDIITLDSEACAPCQYMVESVKAVAPHFDQLVEWREHKIKQRDAVEFMMAMMVKNVPTICIDGQIKFVSIIPSREELIAAIQERINEKFRLHIQTRRNKMIVFGAGCENCEKTFENVQKAVKELGSTVEIVHITKEPQIYEYGITKTPAIIIERQQVKAMGRVPSVEVIKEWLKDLI